jgi:hypothetical protein
MIKLYYIEFMIECQSGLYERPYDPKTVSELIFEDIIGIKIVFYAAPIRSMGLIVMPRLASAIARLRSLNA